MKSLLVIGIVAIFFNGCTNILLPYKDSPSCSQGKYNGYCGSVSDVYKVTKNKYK